MVYSALSLLGVELNYGQGFSQAFYCLQRGSLSLGGDRQLLFCHGQTWNSMLSGGFMHFLDAGMIDLQGLSDHEIHFMSNGIIQSMMVLYAISQMSDTGIALADSLKIFIEFNVNYTDSNPLELQFGRFSPYSLQGVALSPTEPDSGEGKVYQRVERVYLMPGQEKLDHTSPEWV
ncbi:hypothetical protein PLEOSDRAFT_1100164 [Pleurotus ostreatus PC15]|uniref:Uncharacterized protein n=1 Tax=Pleurotus ostreatus (strain PC15) TaxID=1137138 RepID=A0A067PCW0_PLEO1|nr:hypothetical protein PLEOSDRAFT_1100164 [Pleurotus ostreatus PC15]